MFKVQTDYLSGAILKEIAEWLSEKKVCYFKDKTTWTKNIVSRIIDNEKYIGAENYPAIMDEQTFNIARSLKKGKGASKTELPELTELLKSKIVCSECSSKFKRINKWKTREKWLCSGGCKCSTYLDDKVLKVS